MSSGARRSLAGTLCALAFAVTGATAGPVFERASAGDGSPIVSWYLGEVRQATARSAPIVLADFPLYDGLAVDLDLQPFSVTSPRTRFVIGARGKADRPLAFDPAGILLFRGTVRGYPGSSVFLALGEHRSPGGYVDLGPGGGGRFALSPRDSAGLALPAGQTSVQPVSTSPALPPGVPLCGVAGHPVAPRPTERRATAAGVGGSNRGMRHLELAVETDHELFVLFGSAEDLAAYLVTLYGAVSDIFMRDTRTRVELVYARIWDDPDDLFNVVDPSPLSDFQDHWNEHMDAVERDAAQLFSGRRDYPFGGQASLQSLCGSSAYSVVGYGTGVLPDPTRPSPYEYDATVTAHELGHNCGAFHSHDYGIDTCHNPNTSPRRGSIMSYCGQTWSGGNANQDLFFHVVPATDMEDHLDESACIVLDCNLDGVEDTTDIALGTSRDANGNDVPDECEDCNGNGVLDDADIAGPKSTDLNANAIPDECEPDCNGNHVPDRQDIANGTSLDAHGNAIPDECEPDCDGSGTSDYSQIQLSMTLDVDRNAALDSCQDCDTDGTSDLQELAGAHGLWVASGLANSRLREFNWPVGVRTRISSGTTVARGQDVIVAPHGNLWVSSAEDDRVKEYDRLGGYVRDFVSGGALDYPTGLAIAPDGRLLVASRNTDEVLAYDGRSGAFLGAFVAAGSGGLDAPFGLTHGPDGKLHVASGTGEILVYDGSSGAFVDVLVAAASNGSLSDPRGLTFKPDGNLLVASFGSNEVLEFDGSTGAPLGKWAQVGTSSVLTQVSPWGIRIGPNGNVFVVRTGESFGSSGGGLALVHDHDDHAALHLSNAQIYEYDVRNGNFLRTHVGGNDHGLTFPTGFAFVPGWDVDCNLNQLPDGCDIQSGTSQDADASAVPDECEVDCNGNGMLDRLDLIPFGPSLDCNANLTPDACDVAARASLDCTGNGVPDECEADCNGNAVADSCDLSAGTSRDCNANAAPDECDVFESLDRGVLPGWTTGGAGDDATDGIWVLGNPVGTAAQPEFDHTPGPGRACYVTGQGVVGGAAAADDVDGGRTTLVTSPLNLSSLADPEVGYWRWFSNSTGPNPGQDTLTVEVSSNGLTWVPVETVGPTGPEAAGGWFFHVFRVADFVTPGAAVRLRFIARDTGGASTVEAAIDDLVILPDCCEAPTEVESLTLGRAPATQLGWLGQAGALYDVAGGALADVAADGGVIGARCLADDLVTPTWDDPRPDPPRGEGHYYLVRSQKPCGAGTYGSSSAGVERQPAAACP